MKTIKILSVITAAAALIGSNSFGQTLRQQHEKEKSSVSKISLHEAKVDSAADYRNFRTEAESKLDSNQKKIVVLRIRERKLDKVDKAKFEQEVLLFDQRNYALQKELISSIHTTTYAWSLFKTRFNIEVLELNEEITDFGTNNAN